MLKLKLEGLERKCQGSDPVLNRYFVRKAIGPLFATRIYPKTFCCITQVGRKRKNNLCKYFRKYGTSRPEHREGARTTEYNKNYRIYREFYL